MYGSDEMIFRVFDTDSFPDFVDSLADLAPAIERDVARLRDNPTSRDILTALFRAVHNLKGDSALCKLELGVRICFPIESLLSRMRDNELIFTPLIGEVFLLALDRLEQAIEALAEHRTLAPLHLHEMLIGLEMLSVQPKDRIETQAAIFIENITGFRPVAIPEQTHELNFAPFSSNDAMPTEVEPEPHTSQEAQDLAFFRSLAQQLETRSPHLLGRTARVLKLAEETNSEAGYPVNPAQLEAAVYMHDVGMMFLPEAVWLKVERLSDSDRAVLQSHPNWAADLLARMKGWDEAARMVREHHERPLGGGYPQGLFSPDICAGAKILAIVDAFEAVNLKHSHRGHSLSALRAVAEVNACEDQFAPEFIKPFNQVIRRWITGNPQR